MIASLPMYDWPEQAAHWDRFWGYLREALHASGIEAPDALTRDADLWDVWQSADLLLGQTCGLPYRTRLHDSVSLVGTFDFGLPGCPSGYYASVIVARDAIPDDPVATYSVPDSQSGWAALHGYMASHGITPRRTVQSGAHRASAARVAEGAADLAAIDAETWRLIETHDSATAKALTVIAQTPPTPGLPLITAQPGLAVILAEAIEVAIAACDASTRRALHILGFERIPADAYLAVPNPPAPPGC